MVFYLFWRFKTLPSEEGGSYIYHWVVLKGWKILILNNRQSSDRHVLPGGSDIKNDCYKSPTII